MLKKQMKGQCGVSVWDKAKQGRSHLNQGKVQQEISGGFPGDSVGKDSTSQCGRPGFDSWVGNIPWRRACQATLVFSPGESSMERSLEGCSPWGHRIGHDWTTKYNIQHSTGFVTWSEFCKCHSHFCVGNVNECQILISLMLFQRLPCFLFISFDYQMICWTFD